MTYLLFLLFAFIAHIPTNPALQVKFARLDPTSLSQNLAFYELYPDTKEGQLAYNRIKNLLLKKDGPLPSLCKIELDPLIHLVNRTLPTEELTLEEENLTLIERVAKDLPNRQLKGHKIWSEKEMLALPSDQIDLCRALFLADKSSSKQLIRTYEAMIDLMALQIALRLDEHATDMEKVHAINHYIFYEMGFRFPPHSLSTKEIDTYTLLPSVVDSKKGVCLGVSILYLTLAQRLNLNLEIVTPPGHIFVRLANEDLNIETTARGIHIPSDRYLNIEVKSLPKRSIKEVVGLAFINQASVALGKQDYAKAAELYEKAMVYLPEDLLIKELLGLSYLFCDKEKKGKELLLQVKDKKAKHLIAKDTLIEDYFLGHTDIEAMKALFAPVEEENKKALLQKQQTLKQLVEKYPKFRLAYLQIAGIYMQLSRIKEALSYLKKSCQIDPNNPTIHYYLSAIYFERMDYNNAWKHFESVEKITKAHDHFPKPLQELKKGLMQHSPKI